MKEHPILFSGEMVRAILEGRKTQTRRIVKPQPPGDATSAGVTLGGDSHGVWSWLSGDPRDADSWGTLGRDFRCPYGVPGDHLWIRETHTFTSAEEPIYRADYLENCRVRGFENIPPESEVRWTPSIFMPRRACRLTPEVLNVRIEQLQDITPRDAQAEGDKERSGFPEFYARGQLCYIDWFRNLWDSINAKPREVRHGGEVVSYVAYPWDKSHPICRQTEWRGKPLTVYPNPWIWAVDFERMCT